MPARAGGSGGGDRLDRRLDRAADRHRQQPDERVELRRGRSVGDAAHESLEDCLLAGAELAGDRCEGVRQPLGDVRGEQLEGLEELGGDPWHAAHYRTDRGRRAVSGGVGTGGERPPARKDSPPWTGGVRWVGGRRVWRSRRCWRGPRGTWAALAVRPARP